MNKKLAAGIGSVALVLAAVAITGGTFALYHDNTSTGGNRVVAHAGTMFLDPGGTLTSQPVTVGNLNPGESETRTRVFTLRNGGSVAGDLRLAANYYGTDEHGCNPAEAKVDHSCGDPGQGQGELQDHLVVTVYDNNGHSFTGTLAEMNYAASHAFGTLHPNGIDFISVTLHVPWRASNEIQGDAASFSLKASLTEVPQT